MFLVCLYNSAACYPCSKRRYLRLPFVAITDWEIKITAWNFGSSFRKILERPSSHVITIGSLDALCGHRISKQWNDGLEFKISKLVVMYFI